MSKLLNTEEVTELLTYNDYKMFTTQVINYLFGNNTKVSEDGKVKVLPPKYNITDVFVLPAKTLINNEKDIKTTVGRYFFNVYLMVPSFQDKIPYMNNLLRSDDISKLQSEAIKLIQRGDLPTTAMVTFLELSIRLAGFNEIFTPSISTSFIGTNPKIEKRKKELTTQYKKEIEDGDAVTYLNKVEKVLIKEATDELKNEESFCYYDYGGGASMGNHYNDMNIGIGVVDDASKPGKYKIITKSLSDGIDPTEYAEQVNTLIDGSFNRANNTAISGYKTKLIFAATQHLKAGPKDSDCGSTKYQKILVSESSKNDNLYMYIKKGNGLVQLTPDNIDSYVGQVCEFRFPTFCKSKNYICNKCLGDLLYSLNYKAIGAISVVPFNALMYTRMKAMHNAKKKTVQIKLDRYVEEM